MKPNTRVARALIVLIFLLTHSAFLCAQKIHAPILVLAGRENYGLYTGELLKAEGLHEFMLEPATPDHLRVDYLRNFDVVILAKTALPKNGYRQLSDYVRSGGNLIVFSPESQLSGIAGLQDAIGQLSDGYLQVDDKTEMGRGIISESMQFHGSADLHALKSAKPVAMFLKDAQSKPTFPAVTVNRVGKGKVVSFLYNLPESIVLMHQGSKAWAWQERDGMNGVRHMDMFVGMNDEPNWINRDKVHLPQADEQMRLFSHAVEWLAADRTPLPRLWYFPGENKSLTVMTCDGENTGAEDYYEANINTELALVKSKGGTMSVYLIGTGVPANTIARWRADGHEVGIHFDNTENAAKLSVENMTRVYDQSIREFHKAYDRTGSPPLLTVRNHWITWVGWADQAKIEAEHGLRLDFNLYKFDNDPSITRQGWMGGPGYYTGCAVPMKFADEKGDILNIYAAETQVIDEQLGRRGQLFSTFKTLVDRSLQEECYAFITANFHPNNNAGIPFLDDLIRVCDYSNERGVPIWSGEKLLHFLRAREETSFDHIQWSNGKLSFTIASTIGGESFSCLVPVVQQGNQVQSVVLDGKAYDVHRVRVKGTEYILVGFRSGENHAVVVMYGH